MAYQDTFMHFLETRVLDIAKAEVKNKDRICLYKVETFWTTFENSAYLLSKVFRDPTTLALKHPEYPFPIVGVYIADDSISSYKKINPPVRETRDYLEFEVKPFDPIKCGKWHTKIAKLHQKL